MAAADRVSMATVEEKHILLQRLLSSYPKMSIAFSGGVDSTFLLYAALQAKGTAQVVAFYLRSPLQAARSERNCQEVIEKNFPATLLYRTLEMTALDWPEVATNDGRRCYYCKKRMFTAIREAMQTEGCLLMADGTNGDDILSPRPGLQAIEELSVTSPLADAQLTKTEIRLLAKNCGLTNHDLPSNSCLATRVATGLPLTRQRLAMIETAEEYLDSLGFLGCRVRFHATFIEIEVQEKDMAKFAKPDIRQQVQKHFSKILPLPAMLGLVGR
jgi:pyridinium-3,5-biscarboxylic acid mononucleotide sulfurtransferase